MKYLIIFFISLFIGTAAYSQPYLYNTYVNPDQHISDQYIAIALGGRQLFSYRRLPNNPYDYKGRFSSVNLDDFLDAIEQQLNIDGSIDGFAEFADTTYSTVEYVDSVFATIAYVDSTFTLPYDEYVIILSQSGTSAPTEEILDPFEGISVVWSREDVGIYRGTCTPGLSGVQVYSAQPSTSSSVVGFTTQIGLAFPGDIYLYTLNPAGVETDFDGEVYIIVREYNP